MFPLCSKCSESQQQSPCQHTDEERALTGTWVTMELQKALQIGYRVVKIYEVWHFDEVSVYDPDTKEGMLICFLRECFPQVEAGGLNGARRHSKSINILNSILTGKEFI